MNAPLLAAQPAALPWTEVCALADILPASGVCALIGDRQIAVVRCGDAVYALGNFDPFSRAMVLSRGIVGDARGVPKITSPVYKQAFDLRTGRCLDDPTVAVPTWPCRVIDGRVQVQA